MGIFSVVFQDFQLLAFPLGENVAAGRNYDRKKAADCLRKAGFGDRLDALPLGLDTPLYREIAQDGIGFAGRFLCPVVEPPLAGLVLVGDDLGDFRIILLPGERRVPGGGFVQSLQIRFFLTHVFPPFCVYRIFVC